MCSRVPSCVSSQVCLVQPDMADAVHVGAAVLSKKGGHQRGKPGKSHILHISPCLIDGIKRSKVLYWSEAFIYQYLKAFDYMA